jgi:hypothetical protein
MTDQDREMLRDIFAGLAMCGLVMMNKEPYDDTAVAELSYNLADKMLEARKPKEEIGIKTVRKSRTYAKNNTSS